MRVVFTWARRPRQPAAARLRAVASHVFRHLGVGDGEVGVLLCDDETIRGLNRSHRAVDHATDVLAFPLGADQPDGGRYLGDIAISLDTARRQARVAGVAELDELSTLLVHALLHLHGFDHERDGGEMEALETNLRRELGL